MFCSPCKCDNNKSALYVHFHVLTEWNHLCMFCYRCSVKRLLSSMPFQSRSFSENFLTDLVLIGFLPRVCGYASSVCQHQKKLCCSSETDKVSSQLVIIVRAFAAYVALMRPGCLCSYASSGRHTEGKPCCRYHTGKVWCVCSYASSGRNTE